MARLCIFFLLVLTSFIFAQNHLLVTEIVVTPTAGEFVEIHNPTQSTIDLTNYYLTDATFSGGGTYYYNIVTGSNAGGGGFGDFHARFPNGATINPGEFQTIAMNGTDFVTTYTAQPTYELWDTDAGIPNMLEALPGSINDQGGLTNSGEVLILYYWDGQSDLVQDVDYLVWGDKAEAVDKTGISIDGPDPNTDPSTYLDDTSIQNQISMSNVDPHNIGESAQRLDLIENGETTSGGNGIVGHDETSEDLATSFQTDAPNPGTGQGGSTAPSITNVIHSPANPTSSDIVTVSADVTDDGTIVRVQLFYSVDSAPFDSTNMTLVSGDTYESTIPPQSDGSTVEYYIKAEDDEGLTSTTQTFSYFVGTPPIIPIADIQANPSAYTTVTIQGIVTLGAGRTTTQWTSAYVQDTSGRGINIYQDNVVDPLLVRGNEVQITGTVAQFNGITEITNYTIQVISTGNPVPSPLPLNTSQAASDTSLEGTYITITGTITDLFAAGSGTNILVDDGSGNVTTRVWDETGINLSNLSIGDTITVRAVMGIFNSEGQLVPGYQDEIEKVGSQPGDGSGTVTIDPDSVGLSEMVSEAITIQGESPYTLATVSVQVPDSWQWTGGKGNIQLSGSGFSGAAIDVQDKLITISGAAVTDVNTGTATINQLTSPASNEVSAFTVKTAVDGGILKAIANNPTVLVGTTGAPSISNVNHTPANPTSSEIVTVSADVVDDGTVSRVQLFYSVDSAPFDSTDMTLVSGDTYEATIDSQDVGANVGYYVKATDDEGLTSTSAIQSYTVVSGAAGQPHLLITEIVVTPTAGEFIEISNPTQNTIDLSDYYLTDATFSGGGAYYYNIVTGTNAGGGGFGDFHARFPSGATIAPGEFQTVAMSGTDFVATYGAQPTYELWDTDAGIPDMLEALTGSINDQGGLTNGGEVVILYYWDGQSDLVQDVDYVVYGDKDEAVDKSGVSIDGPDQGTDPSTYLNDTPISQQISVSPDQPHNVGESIQRLVLMETGEQFFGGNGITGHNEMSENLSASFQISAPNPNDGPTSTGFADGTGLASIPFTNIDSDSTLDVPVSIVGVVNSPIATIQIDVPLFWQWSGLASDVELAGASLQNASAQVRMEDGITSIIVNNAEITQGDTATVVINGMQTPADSVKSVFWVKTAGEGGNLRFISRSPIVSVDNSEIYLIYDLQNNSSNFTDEVTVRGVTTVGAGLLRQFSFQGDSLTTAYIQDNSGRGINLFQFGIIDTNLQRGYYVEVSGLVTEFNLVTEIEYESIRVLEKDFPLPEPVQLSNQQVNSFKWDGTLLQTHGVVIEKFSPGGGTSIVISDGDGSTTIRVWDTANLDLSDYELNKAIFARGVGGVFISGDNDTIFQILSVYEDQLEIDPNYQPSLDDVFLRVEPYPFVPDRGEKIGITYNVGAVNNHATIRIFDLGGRLILTLLSETATIIQRRIEWDGRNELRDLVPLGTYICHLEVVEQDSGDKKTDMAPIVVGTILSR